MFHVSPVTPCFTPGTLIATERGQRPVESLRRGDKVVTRDNGLKRIYWIGRRDVSLGELRHAERLRPILVRAGAFGEGIPSRDMLVSPNHRFLIRRPASDTAPAAEHLVAARLLTARNAIYTARTLGVSYIHILCDRHQVVLANGAWTESFHPDDAIMRTMEHTHRLELLKLFPEIATIGASVRFPPARPIGEDRSRFER